MHVLLIALVVIMAGTLLLAKVKKDGLGKFFKFISWLNIIIGFLMLILIICGGVCKMAHHCKKGKEGKEGCNKEMKMDCCKKDMKTGNCFFMKKFCDMDNDDEDGGGRVVYIIMNKDMNCDSSMMAGCMNKPGCMNMPGCDTMKSCCPKIIKIKK